MRSTWQELIPISMAIAFALSGCATGEVRYNATMPAQLTSKSFEDVMFAYGNPVKPFKRVGVFQTVGFDTPDVAQKALREKAAELGVDGIAQVKCGSGSMLINSDRNGDCVGMAFVWSRQ